MSIKIHVAYLSRNYFQHKPSVNIFRLNITCLFIVLEHKKTPLPLVGAGLWTCSERRG